MGASDRRIMFRHILPNVLPIAVVYLPVLQQAFSTVSLTLGDWLTCALVASSVLWLREVIKLVTRLMGRARRQEPLTI